MDVSWMCGLVKNRKGRIACQINASAVVVKRMKALHDFGKADRKRRVLIIVLQLSWPNYHLVCRLIREFLTTVYLVYTSLVKHVLFNKEMIHD